MGIVVGLVFGAIAAAGLVCWLFVRTLWRRIVIRLPWPFRRSPSELRYRRLQKAYLKAVNEIGEKDRVIRDLRSQIVGQQRYMPTGAHANGRADT